MCKDLSSHRRTTNVQGCVFRIFSIIFYLAGGFVTTSFMGFKSRSSLELLNTFFFSVHCNLHVFCDFLRVLLLFPFLSFLILHLPL